MSIAGHNVAGQNPVKCISSRVLGRRLGWVLQLVRAGRIVLVDAGQPDGFALLPAALGKYVMGLVDEEYGWPVVVPVDDVLSFEDLRPEGRRHPFVTDVEDQMLAVAVSLPEYAMIKALHETQGCST